MTATAWAHLPNAAPIDRILADVRARPQAWTAARVDAWDAAYYAARDAAWVAARATTRDAAYYAARAAAWDAAWGAILALIAWDDCACVLDMPADAVRLLAASGHQPAILLLPAVIALNRN